MKISKLEIERFIEAYTDYKNSGQNETGLWLNNRTYLENNNLNSIANIIEVLVDSSYAFEFIVKALEALGIEVK